jgi:hypothetical protein
MRWYILRTLLHKEALRHLANRGGIVLMMLLLVAALLLSFFGPDAAGGGLMPGVRLCYLDYAEDGPLVAHLRANVPADLQGRVRFRPLSGVPTDTRGTLVYSQGTGAIQLRSAGAAGRRGPHKVWFWHPGADGAALAPFEIWFWRESLRFVQASASGDGESLVPVQVERSSLTGGFDPRSGMATALVLFGLFFVCVYLMPALTAEERERGVLLAQALSPASPGELLAARFLFYPVVALALAALLAGMYRPAVLTRPLFWAALLVTVAGAMGIGLTIASLARSQRSASMGALCYTLAVALLLFICQQNAIPALPHLALEYHGPRLLHAALTDSIQPAHHAHLLAAGLLAGAWTGLAAVLFRRQGWQ